MRPLPVYELICLLCWEVPRERLQAAADLAREAGYLVILRGKNSSRAIAHAQRVDARTKTVCGLTIPKEARA